MIIILSLCPILVTFDLTGEYLVKKQLKRWDMNQSINLNVMEESNNYYYNQEKILKVTMQYPQFWGKAIPPATVHINEYYECQAGKFWQTVKEQILPDARQLEQEMKKMQQPMRTYEVNLSLTPEYQDDCTASMYFDEYIYTGGAHGTTFRSSDNWKLQEGIQYQLKEFFPAEADYRKIVLDEITKQAQAQMAEGSQQYFDNYEQLIDQNFKEENFYLTEDGLVIYYQQYDIAPYSSGIPEFVIPYSPDGPCSPAAADD